MSKKILVAERKNVDRWYPAEAVNLATAMDGPGLRIGDAIGRLHPHPPTLVHHYTTAQSLNAILRRPASLLLSHIHFTNDYSEYRHGYLVVQNELEAMIAAGPKPGRLAALKCLRERLEYTRDQTAVFIGSFSAGGDKLSQWRGYAQNGYAIGFEYSQLLEVGHSRGLLLLPCSYTPAEHRQLAQTAISIGVDTYTMLVANHDVPLVESVAAIQFEVACTLVVPTMKPKAFEEEQEYRLVSPPYHVQQGDLAFFTRGRQLVPRYPFLLHTADGVPLIHRITIGPPPVDDEVKTGLLWSLAELGFENTEIWESGITYR